MIEFRQISEAHWRAYSNGKKLSDIFRINAKWKLWARMANCTAQELRAIADKLDELNQEMT